MEIKSKTSEEYIRVIRLDFESLKSLGDRTFKQLEEEHFHFQPDSESNSIAVILQHLYGNMKSRFTDFIVSDGEKPDRDRDAEFEEKNASKERLLALWEEGWAIVMDVVDKIQPQELTSPVFIRKEPHSVLQALNRQLSHYAYHIGQIVYIAKNLKQKEWSTLSIPKPDKKSLEEGV